MDGFHHLGHFMLSICSVLLLETHYVTPWKILFNIHYIEIHTMSCLFNSMSHFLPISSAQIRSDICGYLAANRPLIDGIETRQILEMDAGPNYIDKMRSHNTWGGAIEIQAACNLWRLRIVVRNICSRDRTRPNIEFLPGTSSFDRTIELEWSGGHYEPVRVT